MQTHFSEKQLNETAIAEADKIIRSCVHCGFCTATCPTYVLLGNELDSPRGRIYLIKEMLENDRAATKVEAEHIDKCLSCLACTTTCPSGVDYMHLVDHARTHIEKTYKRPFMDRMLRNILAFVMPNREIFKLALIASKILKPFKGLLPKAFKPMFDLAPSGKVSKEKTPELTKASGERKYRMGLHAGCVQQVIGENINLATAEFLKRRGVELINPPQIGCCGALTLHLGKEKQSLETTKAYIDGWIEEINNENLDAIVINTSGCGTTIKDYGHLFKDDPEYTDKAKLISALAKDITEVIDNIGLGETSLEQNLTVAYHSACSLQHGQKIIDIPQKLLAEAGFTIKNINESHLCCGSAGTYNIMQPEIATSLRDRKVSNIEKTKPDIIAAGNLGCMIQIASGTNIPMVHTIELLNWATGGIKPSGLK
ncbi:MAG: glycolate oxidase subunit GlcF [Kordiimonadaceae bacterium]|jgi:glycolate oxidase iron-sulfur subunit|nr:glycolate oxidase subunit GlcF [Kordiimonadaceae bacterium]